MFVKSDKTYDFPKLREVTKVVAKNLNKVIDINYYPVKEVNISLTPSVNLLSPHTNSEYIPDPVC